MAEGPELAARAAIRIIPTEAARPTSDLVRTDGMVTAAAVPVFDDQGQMQAIFYGGDLLNRRYEIVDAIKQQVFRERSLQGQGNRHGDHLPGRPADFDERQARRRLAGGRHSVEQFGLRCGVGSRRDLGRPGVRGQRLVHHGL